MPVVRTPIQVRDTRQIAPVDPPRNRGGELLDMQTSYYARKAAEYGRLFVNEGEEFAEQMVREAVFSEDENGVPQMPENKRKWMGSVVAKTYNNRMAEAMTLRLRNSIRNKINEAQNANIGDFEGFQKQADQSAKAMISTLPQEFRGAFQNLWTTEIVNAGGTVGREQALIEREIQKADLTSNFDETLSDMVQLYEQGPTSLAAAELRFKYQMEEILNAPYTLFSAAEKDTMIKTLIYRVGKSRMISDFNLRNKTVSQLTKLSASLQNPESDEYKEFSKYFAMYSRRAAELGLSDISPWTKPNGGYDGEIGRSLSLDSAKQFAKEIQSELIPLARQRAANAEAQAEKQDMIDDILNGVLANDRNSISAKHRNTFDNALASMYGLENLHWTDWVYGDSKKMSEQTINNIMMNVKTAGFLPMSLQQAFQRLNTVQDEQEFMNTYDVYVRLRDQANIMGNTKDLASLVPEDALLRLEMAELLLAKGSTNDNTLEQTRDMMDTWRELERQDPEWQNAHIEFAAAMRNEGYYSSWLPSTILGITDNNIAANFTADELEKNPKLLDSTLKEFLKEELNLGENTNVHELNEAVSLFKKYFRLQATASEKPLETALEFARKTLNGRYYHDSKYFANGVSSKMAPELYYADPMPRTITEAFANFWTKNISAGAREGLESLIGGSWWRPYADNVEFKEFDFGAALARASIFDVIVDQKINEIMQNTDASEYAKYALPYKKNSDGTYTKKRNGFYEAGVHYHLVPTQGRGGIPTYNIMMIGSGMDNERVFTLAKDVSFHKEFEAMTGEITTYDQTMRYARAKNVLFSELYGDGLRAAIGKKGFAIAEGIQDLGLPVINSIADLFGKEIGPNQNIENFRDAIDYLAESYKPESMQ